MNKIEGQLQRLKPRSLSSEEQDRLWQAVRAGIHREPQSSGAWMIFTWHYKATISLAVLLLIIGGSAGMAWAANDANPGDLLYPVDLAFENVQLTFWPEGQKDTLRVQFADERLREVEGVIGKSEDVIKRGEKAQQALNTAVNQLELAKNILENRDNQAAVSKIEIIIDRLSGVSNQHQQRLEQLEPVSEDDDADKLEVKVRRLADEQKFQIKLKSRIKELRSHLQESKLQLKSASSSLPLIMQSGNDGSEIELEIETEEENDDIKFWNNKSGDKNAGDDEDKNQSDEQTKPEIIDVLRDDNS